jgi:N-methylhydantoinase A/oxoprolinase/acetone carboxylase beta subunit
VRSRGSQRLVLGGGTVDAEVLRGELQPGNVLRGPALCAFPEATLLVPHGWSGDVDAHGTLDLRRAVSAS